MPASPSRRASAGWLDSVDRVAQVLSGAVDGVRPPSDGATEVVPQPPGPVAGVLAFDGHHIVAADVDPTWVHELLPNGDLSAPLHPRFLGALAERLGRPWDNLDAVFAGRGEEGDVVLPLEPTGSDGGPSARGPLVRVPARLGGLRAAPAGRGPDPRTRPERALGGGLRGHRRRRVGADWAEGSSGPPSGWCPSASPCSCRSHRGTSRSLRAVLVAGGYVPIGAEVLYPGRVS